MKTIDEIIEAAYQGYLKDAKLTTAASLKAIIDKGGGSLEARAAAYLRYGELLEIEKKVALEEKFKTLFPALSAADLSNVELSDNPEGDIIIRSKR